MRIFPLKIRLIAAGAALAVVHPHSAWAIRACLANELRNYLVRPELPESFAATFGIELEGYVPRSIGREGLALELAKMLEQRYPEKKVLWTERFGVFILKYFDGDQPVHWQIKDDGSLRNSPGKVGVEIASPILRNEEDLKFFNEVADAFRKKGMVAHRRRAGIHIHVGLPYPQAAELRALQAGFAAIDQKLRNTFGVAWPRRSYARPLPKEIRDRLGTELAASDELKTVLDQIKSRNLALNLQAIKSHGTVEIRLFNSTMNTQHIAVMAELSQKFVLGIREKNAELIQYLIETRSPSIKKICRILKVDLGPNHQVLNEIWRQAALGWAKDAAYASMGVLGTAALVSGILTVVGMGVSSGIDMIKDIFNE